MMLRAFLRFAVLVEWTAFSCMAMAQGTKLWTVDRYTEFAKGTSEGVAIRSDGRLEAGPATSLFYITGGSYVWSLAASPTGNSYVGMGGTASGSATVMNVAADGKATKFFEAKELGVQALRILSDGAVLVVTSPDGKVYSVPSTGGTPKVLFDSALTEEKPKYLWDAAQIGDSIFVAAGAPALVYKIPASGGKAEVLFRTADQHIRCLLATPDGTLWAGSDGSGVIYRIAALRPGAQPFAAYAAPRREITAMAADAAGNLYAAGVGTRGPSPLPPLPVTGSIGVSITFVPPASAAAASTNALVPEGSEIYRIARDGAPSKLLALKEDVIYALAFRNGALMAATGNRGHVYRVDTEVPGRFTDIAHVEAAQAMVFAQLKDGLLVGTSNTGKVFKLRDRLTSPATYTSTVFDAQGFSQWGRAEVRSDAPADVDLYARSGNVESPLLGWSEWVKISPTASAITVPAARFAQWKAVLREGGKLEAVSLNYLQANVAPVVEEVVVQPGARVPPGNQVQTGNTVQISFPAPPNATPALSFPADASTSPLSAQKDKTAVTVRWAAHDDNGDDLLFAIFYRGVGEANWHLLKDKISDRFFSFDSALLPDGAYTLKVVASDAPVHPDADALKSEKTSDVFVIDTTPPVPGLLTATIEGGKIHARLEVHDATSPLAHAEYSVDASLWQYLEPVGRLSDGQTELYDFLVQVPATLASAEAPADAREHLIAIRVYDRYENVAAVKTVVR